MSQPKDLADGTRMGLTSAVAGVGAGLAVLVSAPVKGAVDGVKKAGVLGGAVGAVGGLLVGAVGGVVLPTKGVGMGVAQIVQGALHTPASIAGRVQGKEWDQRTGQWVFYNLPEEAELVLNMDETGYLEYIASSGVKVPAPLDNSPSNETQESHPTRSVKETELYDVLGVAPSATSAEIKKAYYKLARTHHPDKRPDDIEAKDAFQRISNAYQVLSDEEHRTKYDASGRAGLEEQPKMDAKAFYGMVFGSTAFEPLIGVMESTMEMSMEADEFTIPEGRDPRIYKTAHRKLVRWKREVAVALNLVDVVKPLVEGTVNESEFRREMASLGEELANAAVGAALLSCIGYCYVTQAHLALGCANVCGGVGERLGGAASYWTDKFRGMGNVVGLGYAAVSASVAQGRQQATTRLVEVLFHSMVLEIEGLLARVVFKVCHDTAVEKETRSKRARALVIVGEEFQKLGISPSGGVQELAEKIAGLSA